MGNQTGNTRVDTKPKSPSWGVPPTQAVGVSTDSEATLVKGTEDQRNGSEGVGRRHPRNRLLVLPVLERQSLPQRLHALADPPLGRPRHASRAIEGTAETND